jgi:hypothetical protein
MPMVHLHFLALQMTMVHIPSLALQMPIGFFGENTWHLHCLALGMALQVPIAAASVLLTLFGNELGLNIFVEQHLFSARAARFQY